MLRGPVWRPTTIESASFAAAGAGGGATDATGFGAGAAVGLVPPVDPGGDAGRRTPGDRSVGDEGRGRAAAGAEGGGPAGPAGREVIPERTT